MDKLRYESKTICKKLTEKYEICFVKCFWNREFMHLKYENIHLESTSHNLRKSEFSSQIPKSTIALGIYNFGRYSHNDT